ncbi:MAG TPA: SMC-Scp complex subunit ScpB [Gammaproteobacteria bacterium]|nr:SMC-Scp complex subunit ScpB [Gammaproteobacteria bacterium]
MTLPQIKNIIEAALMVSERPLTLERLMTLFKPLEIDGSLYEQVTQALGELRQEYTGRGIELKEVASGFRFQARAELSPWLNQLWEERSPRYSRALLETLAIIAYRQPITRGEIEALRGVSVSSPIIRTLLEREWIRIAGHREVPGRPAIYVTTPQFLDHFNLKSLAELPLLSESPGELRLDDPTSAPDRAAPIARKAAG